MNLLLRILTMFLTTPFRSRRVDAAQGSALTFWIWPTDLDMFFHVNNARYLTFMEVARWDMLIRFGLLGRALSERWVMPIASANIRYIKSLHLFQRVTVRTKVLFADDRNLFFEQTFLRGTQVVAVGAVRLAFLKGGERLSPRKLIEQTEFCEVSKAEPEAVQRILALEATFQSSQR